MSLTPQRRSSTDTQPTPPPDGSQSARQRGRYGGKAQRGSQRTRGGRKIITRPSQRVPPKVGAWGTSHDSTPNNGDSSISASFNAESSSPLTDLQQHALQSSMSPSKNVHDSPTTTTTTNNNNNNNNKSQRLPRNINRGTSKSVLAAITFGQEDHDDVARQATTELENRLNEITGDEIKAATTLMRKMRKKCDWYHLEIKKKNLVLKNLQKQVIRLQQKTESNDSHRGALRRRAGVLRKTLANLSKQYETQQMNMKIYNHMSKRLMKQVKGTDKEMTEVQRDLQQVSKKHKEMELLHHKLANRKSNLIHTKAELRQKLRDYQDRRTHALLKIERVIQESQLETQLIKDHVKNAEDQRNGGTRTERMKKLFSNKRAQNAQLPKEFRDQSQRMQKLEEAFLKIRNSTGLSDVNEIVAKFLSRDEKYESLCNAADAARHKIDALKKEKDEVQTAIAEFQGNSKSRSVGNRDLYRDVDKYDQMLTETTRKHHEAKEKSTRVRLLLEESRVTVGRFLKTLSNFGDSSLASSDEPSRFVPSISSLPKALQNVKAQVAVMLEQLSQLLAAEESQSGSRPGTRDRTRDSTTFITSLPTPPAQRKMSSPSSLQEKVHKESERQEETPEDQAEGEDGPAAASTEETLNLESILTSASISKVLDNPKADRLIFESLMSATPDLSNQNLRVDRERNKVLVKDSAVAHLLGIELPVLAEDQDQGEHDVSGIPHEEDPGITREPRGWDAMLPKHDHTAILQRSKIKNLSNHLVDRRRRREMKETAEIEKKMKEQEAREKRKYEEGKGKANDDWF
jgi:hypothetical protein